MLCKLEILSLLKSHKPSTEFVDKLSIRLYAFSLKNLKHLKTMRFGPDDRTKIVNSITTKIMSLGGEHLSILRDSLGVLLYFTKNPRRSMNLIKEPELLWDIAQLYDKLTPETGVEDDMSKFRQLAVIVLDYSLSRRAQESGVDPLVPFELSLRRHCLAIDWLQPSMASIATIAASFELIARNSSAAETTEDNGIRQRFFTMLFRQVARSTDSANPFDSRSLLLLESIASFPQMIESLPTSFPSNEDEFSMSREKALLTLKSLQAVTKFSRSTDIEKGLSKQIRVRNDIQAQVLVQTRNILALIEDTETGSRSVKVRRLELELFLTARGFSKCLRELEEDFMSSDAEKKVTYLQELISQVGLTSLHLNSFELLRKLLGSSIGMRQRTNALKLIMSQSCRELAVYLTLSGRCHQFAILSLENVIITNSWAITQGDIDKVLSTITYLTSKNDVDYDDMTPDKIFLGLCSLIRALLTSHRVKIGGRYHLIVGAMSGLLRCLFDNHASDGTTGTIRQPNWLFSPRASPDGAKLGAPHAETYSRLLEAICNPSVLAVKQSGGSGPKLTNETKKARAIAGQYLQYIVVNFCRNQLAGRLIPSMRAALNPGLYAVFDAMSRDVMRTASDSLDPSGKVIFKALYDEYQKFGKWRGS